MGLIEVTTFRLLAGADEAGFLAADQRFQAEFAYQQPGLIRRTTARGADAHRDDWVVIELWRSAGDADDAAARRVDDRAAQSLAAFVDPKAASVRRYADLD